MTQQQELPTLLSGYDVDLFRSGKHYHIYNKLGAHTGSEADIQGGTFRGVGAERGGSVGYR
ncbi:hypothetical protein [Dyadobacter sp. 676]|uniref:Uncharacterized protein n=1 Tax=Dyadobacter sp. 676 TaxID=3088362 RepID=A0AAU8FPP5_9BACT